jgi:hypothetical protein
VTVAGVVTADAGRLGTPALIAIQDSTGGIVVKVPDGTVAPARGIGVIVTGPIADPYGQLEIRPAAGGIRLTGPGAIPSPADVVVADLGEGTEAILVDIVGVTSRAPSKSTSGDLTFDFADGSGHAFRVIADGSSGVTPSTVPIGRTVRLTGVAGQRASRKGVLDGYRIWIRDRADVVVVAGPTPTPSGPTAISVAAALAKADGVSVVIEATVTAGTALLDSSGRRIVVQDGSGAVEVLLPVGSAGPAVGSVIRVKGAMAHAWGRAATAGCDGRGSARDDPGPAGDARVTARPGGRVAARPDLGGDHEGRAVRRSVARRGCARRLEGGPRSCSRPGRCGHSVDAPRGRRLGDHRRDREAAVPHRH